jgi:kinetochore protein Spc7/SPC105
VEALRAELSEQSEQFNYLRGRLQEIAISKQEEASAYAKAQHFLEMKENSTRTEVFRLRGLCFYCAVTVCQTNLNYT